MSAAGRTPSLIAELAARVNQRLPTLLPPASRRPESVHSAMLHGVLSPGKRLRPVLTMIVADIFGSRRPEILDIACAVELVHASSLVLDDLPSMDDASLRRGQPTVHKVYGIAVAELAAFGLLNRAYALVVEASQRIHLRRYGTEDLVHHLSVAIGTDGLIGGQTLDLESRPADLDLDLLEYIHSHKTGALFLAAAELGAMAADARRRDLDAVSRYAKNLGLAFQIQDDLLDVLATSAETGKDSGQDENKSTFVGLLGIDGAKTLLDDLLDFAVKSVAGLGRRAEPLERSTPWSR